MKPTSTLSLAGQWLTGLAFGTIALYCGWISLNMNIRFGAQFSDQAAQIFAVSDIAKILLPIMAAYIGWSLRLRLAWGVAIVISITAALSSLLQDQAQIIKDNQAISHSIANAQSDANRIRAELSRIKEASSATSLQALAEAKQSAASREAARGGCGPACERLQAQHAMILARIGQAQRRDALQRQLNAATVAISKTPEKANGPSDHLASLTGGDKIVIASIFSALISIAQLIILEFLATFSGDAGATIRNAILAMRCNRLAKRRNAVATACNTDATQAQPAATPTPKRATKAYYLDRLEREHPHFAEKVQRGEMSVYAACIGVGLRKPAKKDWTKPAAYGCANSAKAKA